MRFVELKKIYNNYVKIGEKKKKKVPFLCAMDHKGAFCCVHRTTTTCPHAGALSSTFPNN